MTRFDGAGQGASELLGYEEALSALLALVGRNVLVLFSGADGAPFIAGIVSGRLDRGEPDDGSRYYEHWLAALERLVTVRGLTSPLELHRRKDAWAYAYRHTPHGKPVELRRSSADAPAHD